MKVSKLILSGAMGLVLCATTSLQAVPLLQLYVEGATWDSATESWVGEFKDGDTIRLWTIANVGSKGTILDVKLAIAYDSADAAGVNINIVGSTTGGYAGFTDPSKPFNPVGEQSVDGAIPQLWDGKDLPLHGAYGPGITFTEFYLGDFGDGINPGDSPGGNFIESLPDPVVSTYQINVYEITITGTDAVHFDLYNHYQAQNKAKAVFAPFSHDAGGGSVPDGGTTIALLGLAVAGLEVLRRRKA